LLESAGSEVNPEIDAYSNSEHDMKYPHRWQTILQRWDSRRVEQTGQNWLGNSGTPGDFAVGGTAG